jgi:hypothetical protein
VDLILPYLSILTLLGLFSGPQEPVEVPEQQPWSVLWRSLAAEPGPLERAKLVSAWEPRLNVRAAGEGSTERYRRQLARNALGLERRDLPALVPEPSYLGAPVEAWIAARFRPADRVRLVALGIGEEGLSRDQEKRRLQRGFEIFLELEGDFQVGAREVAEALHRRAHSTWSAFCLEGIQRRCGSLDLALDTVNSMLPPLGKAQGAEADALLGRRAIIHAGSGHQDLARADLGRLLVAGFPDAHQILGLDALLEGDWQASSALFGVLLDRSRSQGEIPPPWALRGFGVSLLPR